MSPAAGSMERPDIDDIGPFSFAGEAVPGLATLAGKRKRLAACRFRVTLNKLKLLNIKVFNNLARALLKCWRRKPHRQTGSQP
ncbi:hypothetical protein P4234_26700 [Pseudomonas aeruginosa]|nr:hypothetical protein [Pseudomonas aeruginosa]